MLRHRNFLAAEALLRIRSPESPNGRTALNAPPTIQLTPPPTASSALEIEPEEATLNGFIYAADDDALIEEPMDFDGVVPALLNLPPEQEPDYPEGSGPYGF